MEVVSSLPLNLSEVESKRVKFNDDSRVDNVFAVRNCELYLKLFNCVSWYLASKGEPPTKVPKVGFIPPRLGLGIVVVWGIIIRDDNAANDAAVEAEELIFVL